MKLMMMMMMMIDWLIIETRNISISENYHQSQKPKTEKYFNTCLICVLIWNNLIILFDFDLISEIVFLFFSYKSNPINSSKHSNCHDDYLWVWITLILIVKFPRIHFCVKDFFNFFVFFQIFQTDKEYI